MSGHLSSPWIGTEREEEEGQEEKQQWSGKMSLCRLQDKKQRLTSIWRERAGLVWSHQRESCSFTALTPNLHSQTISSIYGEHCLSPHRVICTQSVCLQTCSDSPFSACKDSQDIIKYIQWTPDLKNSWSHHQVHLSLCPVALDHLTWSPAAADGAWPCPSHLVHI